MDRVLSYQSILASAQATQHTNKMEATGAILLRSLHGSAHAVTRISRISMI